VLSALYSDVYILGPKLLRWNFLLNLLAIYTKWCAQTFPPISGLFTIFDRNFENIVAPPSDEDKNSLALLKVPSILKRTVVTESKSTHKPRHNTCSNYVPHERTARRTPSVRELTRSSADADKPARRV